MGTRINISSIVCGDFFKIMVYLLFHHVFNIDSINLLISSVDSVSVISIIKLFLTGQDIVGGWNP